MKRHIETITNLLLGAAYADKRLEGREVESIRRMLNTLLGTETLPDRQAQQIRTFNPAKFDAQRAASALQVLSQDDKRKILELIATVNESDDELDLDESEYLKTVARGLGLQESSFQDLTIEILEQDDLANFFEQ